MTQDPGGNPTPNRGGDLYDSGMGPLGPEGVTGGVVRPNAKPGIDHISIHGNDRHFSHDIDQDGASGVHGTQHGPNRPW